MSARPSRGTTAHATPTDQANDRFSREHSAASATGTRAWPPDEDLAPAAPPAATTAPPADGRVLSGLTALAGVWLFFSPWIVNYTSADPWWNAFVFGAAVVVVAVVRMAAGPRTAMLSWLNALFGAWVFASGFWLSDSTQASWNTWIVGAVIVVLALLSLGAARSRAA